MGWNKPAAQYERYLAEQREGRREVLVAFVEDGSAFAGYLTVVWQPDYPPLRAANVPEIQDLNVLPHLRRRGIASRLLDQAEQQATERGFDCMGIAAGMTPDYGAAQRLYVRRGYVPDGLGLTSHDRFVQYGDTVTVDDGLALHFTKQLIPLTAPRRK